MKTRKLSQHYWNINGAENEKDHKKKDIKKKGHKERKENTKRKVEEKTRNYQ